MPSVMPLGQSHPIRRPTLRDIASELGISRMAVSLALRGSLRISEEKRRNVRDVAERIGYRPDPMLASLAAYRHDRKPHVINSCLAWLNQWDEPEALRANKEFDGYWVGAKEAAENLGYHLEEFRWPYGKSGRRLQNILEARGIVGLLIPPHQGQVSIPDFDWDRVSMVRFGASVANIPAHTVTSDQSHCSRLCYLKAREYGYSRIGYLSRANFEQNTGGHFHGGFLSAQAQFAQDAQKVESLVLERDPARDADALAAWFRDQKPDAVISTLPKCWALIERLGMKIPHDLALVATSVRDGDSDAGTDQNSHEIGRVAVSTLAGLILGNERGIPSYQRRILVAGRWVDGKGMTARTTMS